MSEKTGKDPFAQREADNYERPIASREYILQCFDEAQGPLPFERLAHILEYPDDERKTALQHRLGAMVRDGQLFRNRKGQYAVVTQADLVVGEVIAHSDGFGFLRPDTGADDLYLSAKQMRTLMHGDRVIVRPAGLSRRGKPEGKLVEILERRTTTVSGHFFQESGVGFVRPQDRRLTQDILIPPGAEAGARHGDIVSARITAYATVKSHTLGAITEILGNALTTDMCIELAIRKFGLPHVWPEAVQREIAPLGETLPAAEIDTRRDIRDLPLVTIDGADARDFDDAVYCRPTANGWQLFVAIADVSWYVSPGTALDAEAYARSTSAYFPGRVVPMLPPVLADGLCSINPHTDRFCILCEIDINARGEQGRARFDAAVMRSHARLTYTQVAAMLHDRQSAEHAGLLPHLEDLHALYRALAGARRRRGAIDFGSEEVGFVFDDQGQVCGVKPLVRNDAHRLIEECMIAANTAAARYLEKHRLPALYRVHAGPAEDDLAALREFLQGQGLTLGGGQEPQPGDYDKLLSEVRQRPDAHVIRAVLLRSLKQAIYQPANEGHFGLSLDSYTHFTSPIRRYPDLLVHRAIRHLAQGGNADHYQYASHDMEKIGQQCSTHERRADEASWDVAEALKCQYLQDHLEQEFNGVIAGVNNFGLFVEMENLGISGLVHVTSLGHDYFHHDPIHHRLQGEHTGIAFRLGEAMKVRLIRVDVEDRKVDLEPVRLPDSLAKGTPGKGRRRARGLRRGRR